MSESFENGAPQDTLENDQDRPAPFRFYSVAEVAKAFGRSSRTIRWWEQTGRLKTFAVGRSKYVSEAEIRRLMGGGEGLDSGQKT